jgi:enamine deaminase RidA (YjgF/YER057c/UK114 family)
MSIEYHDSRVLLPPPSPYCVLVKRGGLLHLSGVVAADIPDAEAVQGDIAGETRVVLDAIAAILAEHGSGMGSLVRVQVHLAQLADLPVFDRIYAGYLPPGRHPARTAVGGVQLHAGARVEVTCTAEVSDPDATGTTAC